MLKKVENAISYLDKFNGVLIIITSVLLIVWIHSESLFSYSESKLKDDLNQIEVALEEYFTENSKQTDIQEEDNAETNEDNTKITEDNTEINEEKNNVKNNAMWWPIGSNSITTIGDKKYASAPPACTNYIVDTNSSYSTNPVYAIDISCGTSNIIAVMDGTVESTVDSCYAWDMVGGESTGAQATCGGSYGNNVVIDHGNGIKTRYAHLASVNVKAGDIVHQGEVIGIEGNTGHVIGSTGIHLHFEVIVNNQRVIPTNGYVSAIDTRPISTNTSLNNS